MSGFQINRQDSHFLAEEIAVVVVSPFALGVKVGNPFESVVPDAGGLSYWRDVLVEDSSTVVWGRILIHSLQGLRKTRPDCVLCQLSS
jgi:hypothetical protein